MGICGSHSNDSLSNASPCTFIVALDIFSVLCPVLPTPTICNASTCYLKSGSRITIFCAVSNKVHPNVCITHAHTSHTHTRHTHICDCIHTHAYVPLTYLLRHRPVKGIIPHSTPNCPKHEYNTNCVSLLSECMLICTASS